VRGRRRGKEARRLARSPPASVRHEALTLAPSRLSQPLTATPVLSRNCPWRMPVLPPLRRRPCDDVAAGHESGDRGCLGLGAVNVRAHGGAPALRRVPFRWLPARALRTAHRFAAARGSSPPMPLPGAHDAARREFPQVPFLFGPEGENLYDSSAIAQCW